MKISERIKAESTKVGKIMKTWVAGFFTLTALVGGLAEYFVMLPPIISDSIPSWAKIAVFAAGAISFMYGHWTVVKQKKDDKV